MTTNEKNRMIAEFVEHPYLKIWASKEGKNGDQFPFEKLEYHKDWRLLMPVMAKVIEYIRSYNAAMKKHGCFSYLQENITFFKNGCVVNDISFAYTYLFQCVEIVNQFLTTQQKEAGHE